MYFVQLELQPPPSDTVFNKNVNYYYCSNRIHDVYRRFYFKTFYYWQKNNAEQRSNE